MKTILSIINDVIHKREGEEISFEEIYEQVEMHLMDKWKIQFQNSTLDEIKETKKGEVYKILTVEGSFLRTPEGKWTLRKF
ncbi:MAG: DNA-directed RNA polymerase subunit delta [Metamycoplasmataceae bacterium]